jgi:SAM-dependent methyltransferase
MMKYDLELFKQLNEEYSVKPIVKAPRLLDKASQQQEGLARVKKIRKVFNLRQDEILEGKRILEIGCGRANTSRAVADALHCTVTGVDVERYSAWKDNATPDVNISVLDISTEDYSHLGQFDYIYSFAVWEHIRHPYAAMKAAFNLLRPGGTMYFYANLYRGAKASHRYRQVFFPWPHLLFTDDVFHEFYISIGRKPQGSAWVNKLVAAEYLLYVNQIGFEVIEEWYNVLPLDVEFYNRFSDVLERYPIWDLERDFIHLLMKKPL